MSKYRSNAFFKNQVITLVIIYLFFALTNILLMPHYTAANANASIHSGPIKRRQSIQPQSETLSHNVITDKSIIDDDLLNLSKHVAITVLFVLGGFIFLNTSPRIFPPNHKIYYNLRYSFLFFCKFVI